MPVKSIGQSQVIESGAFVLPKVVSEAHLVLAGADFFVGAVNNLSPGEWNMSIEDRGGVIRFGAFGGGNNLAGELAAEMQGVNYRIHMSVTVIDGAAGRDYQIVYTLTR